MYKFIVENANGEQLQLTQNPKYALEITNGLLPPSAIINTSKLVNFDGQVFNSSYLNMRNLVLMIYPQAPDIEANRIALYRIIKSKQYIKCYFQNGLRNVYIEGYVESIDGNLFDQMQVIQVSILCPKPYWLGLTQVVTELSKVTKMFEFPFSIDAAGIPFSEFNQYDIASVVNNGDVPSGMIIDICFTDEATITAPKIYNANTNEFFGLNVILSGAENAVIRIDSVNKSVQKIVNGAVVGNYLQFIMPNSTWLKAYHGENLFYYTDTSGSDDMYLKISFDEQYEGV